MGCKQKSVDIAPSSPFLLSWNVDLIFRVAKATLWQGGKGQEIFTETLALDCWESGVLLYVTESNPNLHKIEQATAWEESSHAQSHDALTFLEELHRVTADINL